MKVFKNLSKTSKESISSNFADFFYLKSTKRTLGHSNTAWKVSKYWVFLVRIFPHSDWMLNPNVGKYGPEKTPYLDTFQPVKGHSNSTWPLQGHSKDTQGAFGQSRHSGTRALEALRHSKKTWAFRHWRHLGAWRVFGHSGTQALGHLGTRGTWDTLFSRLRTMDVIAL